MEAAGYSVAGWVKEMTAVGITSFYKLKTERNWRIHPDKRNMYLP